MNKDVYLYLTEFVDDKTALNMLSVNKKFILCFEYILKKRYPLLLRFKTEKETWRLFYMEMIFNIGKLRKIEIPYIPNKYFNPRHFYDKYGKLRFIKKGKKNIYEEAMIYAAQIGDKNIVEKMIEHGVFNFEFSLHEAVINNHINIVEIILKQGVISEDYALTLAAERGYIDIAKILISYGARSFSESMMDAAHKGHVEMVKLMIQHGGRFFESSLNCAAKNNNLDIVKLMVEHGAKNFSQGIDRTTLPEIKEYLSLQILKK